MAKKPDTHGFHSIKNWAPILGRWKIEERALIYEPEQAQDRPFGICVSDERFSEGEARLTVTPKGDELDGRLLVGYQSPSNDYYLAGIGGYDAAYSISHFTLGVGWRPLAVAGSKQNLKASSDYKVSVRVQGQRITLTVDGVRVLEHVVDTPLPYGQLGLFGWGSGGTTFSNISVREEPGTVFVVMQLSDDRFHELYRQVIQEICKEFGLTAFHAGDVFGPGLIIQDITRAIDEAKVVIAEITVEKPNVFYELGYSHALRKPTILLAEKGVKLPFDVQGYRCLFYENSIGGKQKIEEGLRRHLSAILRT